MTQSMPNSAPASTWVEYLRLGKARIYHHAYGWVLALVLLRADGRLDSSAIPPMIALLVWAVAGQFAGGALDDLGGFRDGSDAQNYAGRPAKTRAKKPLITGGLTEAQAVRFAAIAGAVSITAGITAAVLSEHATLPAFVAMIVGLIGAMSYSTGLRLSYRPGGLELTIFLVVGAIALVPYWLVSGELNARVLIVSALFGLWFLLIVSYGNASDREGDAAVHRQTMAVLLPPKPFAVFLVCLFLASVALLIAFYTKSGIDSRLAILSAPVVVVHASQIYFGPVRHDWRKARFVGLTSVDLGCLGLIIALLIDGS